VGAVLANYFPKVFRIIYLKENKNNFFEESAGVLLSIPRNYAGNHVRKSIKMEL
jgi:hypothetical protein